MCQQNRRVAPPGRGLPHVLGYFLQSFRPALPPSLLQSAEKLSLIEGNNGVEGFHWIHRLSQPWKPAEVDS